MQDKVGGRFDRHEPRGGGGPRPPRGAHLDRAARRERFARFVNWLWSLSMKQILYWRCFVVIWYTTFDGVLQLIEANTGPVDFHKRLAIGFAVLLLVFAIGYFLDELLKPKTLFLRSIYLFGYAFLLLLSVGFSFGFYWKQMYSTTLTRELASAGIVQVQSSLGQAQRRLEQVQQSLRQLAQISTQRAEEEDQKGTSCPDSPGPTKGPRYRLRVAEAGQLNADADLMDGKIESLKGDIASLNPWLALVQRKDATDTATGSAIADPDGRPIVDADGTRNTFLDKVDGKVGAVIGLYDVLRTDTALAAMKQKFEQRSRQEVFTENGKSFGCRDPQLQGALANAAMDIGALPLVKNPGIRGIEGAKANIEAFQRLWTTVQSVTTSFKIPPTPEEVAERRREAVRLANEGKTKPDEATLEHPGLGGADFIPLVIAVFIDFILFAVAVNRPFERLGYLRQEVLDRRHGEIAEALEKLLRRIIPADFHWHYVFRHAGQFYIAIPERLDNESKQIAAAFAAMEDLQFMKIVPAQIMMQVQKKLQARGSRLGRNAAKEKFLVYRMYPDAMPRILRDLLLRDPLDRDEPVEKRRADAQASSVDIG